MNFKELTQSLIALIVVLGAITSLFFPIVNETGSQVLRVLAGTVIGFYFGAGTFPILGRRK